ncbi:MAG: magnesium chelatase subunit D family protein [Methanomicrobiales archaeon]
MHSSPETIFPFTAIIGQDEMKKALVLNAVNPSIGGVLIRGERGTAKSTAVRALAAVLPEIEVIEGCPFSCSPSDSRMMCGICAERFENDDMPPTNLRPVRVVTLPLGSTEERVVGTIDIEKAFRDGIKALEPGILAAANRGILYIDEVNLLEDHVVDVLLDAAAMGVNVVEREGISLSHPARFILIGTMNPEEGELRPQLLDRFGLQVDVEGIGNPADRVRVARSAEAFEMDPAAFFESHADKQQELRAAIIRARDLLSSVAISDDILHRVAKICIDLGVVTHRAEITISRTSRAIAALDGRTEVSMEDVREAMVLALPHRLRRRPFEEPSIDRDRLDELMDDRNDEDEQNDGNTGPPPAGGDDGRGEPEENPETGDEATGSGGEAGTAGGERHSSRVFAPGDPIDPTRIRYPAADHRRRRKTGSGKRYHTLSADRRGRYVRSRETTDFSDISVAATLRAAAVRSAVSSCQSSGRILLRDLQQKVRRGKRSVVCMFVVDVSGSMGANNRMEAAKGAVFSLLEDAYCHRDRVGLVAFRGTGADLVLPPSRSMDLAHSRLRDIPTGGRTPLADGLHRGLVTMQREMRQDEGTIPLMVLISDGRANAGSGNIREDVVRTAGAIGESGIHLVVVDTEESDGDLPGIRLGLGPDIAAGAKGSYYRLSELTPDRIQEITRTELDAIPMVS